MARGIPYDGAGDVRVHVFANIVDTKKYGVIGTYLSIYLHIYLPAYLSYLLSSTYLSIFYLLSSVFCLLSSVFCLRCISSHLIWRITSALVTSLSLSALLVTPHSVSDTDTIVSRRALPHPASRRARPWGEGEQGSKGAREQGKGKENRRGAGRGKEGARKEGQ